MDAAGPHKSQGPRPRAVVSETPEPASRSAMRSLCDPSEFITSPEPPRFPLKKSGDYPLLNLLKIT